MDQHIARISDEIHALEAQLEQEFARRRAQLAYDVRNRVVHFEAGVQARHRAMRKRLLRYIFGARPLILLTAPVIYSLILPFALLDLFVSVYQTLCFPVYGIPTVRRRDYLIFDRGHLAYLNGVERLNCAYCSYANGLVAYVREVASRTEQYWCPIKHSRQVLGGHERYPGFSDYGDAEAFSRDQPALRDQLRETPQRSGRNSPIQ